MVHEFLILLTPPCYTKNVRHAVNLNYLYNE